MFIVCDGPNGAGKTSLIKSLELDGIQTLSSPNGTPLAKMLRPACRGTDPWTDIDPRIQFMLFSAARYDEYLRLVHGRKEVIVADRWWTSTYVYQCVYQGIDVSFMEYTIHPEEKIDLVIHLDAANEVILNRVMSERQANASHGKCTWTKQEESVIEIANIYRVRMPEYLNKKNIALKRIDTTDLSQDEVKSEVKSLIRKHGGEI